MSRLNETFEQMQARKASEEYASGLNPMPWFLSEAQEMVSKVYKEGFSFGYHLAVGGGVLTRGCSFNDLDIIAIYGESEEKLDPLGLAHLFEKNCNLVYDRDFEVSHIRVFKLKEKTPVGSYPREVDILVIKTPDAREVS